MLLRILTFIVLIFPNTVQAQKTKSLVEISTPLGFIFCQLFNETPKHKASFIQLVDNHYFDSLTFNRVIPNFVIQGGCPDTPEGFTDSAFLLPPEILPQLKHKYGALAAGRDNNAKKYSARCQFYIVQNKKGLPKLDGNYTIFGKVISGFKVIKRIIKQPRDKNDTPLKPITMHIYYITMKKSDLRIYINHQSRQKVYNY